MAVTQVFTNVVPNPRAAGTGGVVTGWIGTVGGQEVWASPGHAVERAASGGPGGASYGYIDISASMDPPIGLNPGTGSISAIRTPVVGDATYTVSVDGMTTASDTTGYVAVRWYNFQPSGDAYINPTQMFTTEYVPMTANEWRNFNFTIQAPSDASWMMVDFSVYTGPYPAPSLIGKRVAATQFLVVPNAPGAVAYTGGYFDGDTAAAGDVAYAWTGTPHNSRSTATYTFPDPVVALMQAEAAPVPPPPAPGVEPRVFRKLQLKGFNSTEDSTPIDPSDTTGGVGQFTLDVDENDETAYLLDIPVDLIDKAQGTTRGTIRGISGNNGDITLTADSRMALLAVDRQVAPFTGTLGQAFTYYLEICGITDGLVIDTAIADRPVTFRGWYGNVWDFLKKVATAEQVELSLVSNNVVMRELRQRTAQNYRDSSRAWAFDTTQLARSIEIYYYNNEYKESGLAWPPGGWNEDVKIQTVDAGETVEFDLDLDSSLVSVEQPVCVDWVDRTHDSSSVYAVSGNDGLIIPPEQWEAGGGSLTVAINEDTHSLTVTIVGSSEEEYAPFQIAMPAGTGDRYSSLRIVGEGVFSDKQLLTMNTSVDPDRVSQEVGATIDNEAISTREQAISAGLWALKRWGGTRHTVNVGTTGINRLGDTGSYAYPTIAQFNEAYAGWTIEDFNDEWAGKTFADFNELWNESVRGDFANQAFGNIAGARVFERDTVFRIRTATVTPFGITYTAEEDATIADFNAKWAGATIEDFNTEWAGRSFADFNATPLRRISD